MSIAREQNTPLAGLRPPTVTPPPEPLPLRKFLFKFVANPLRALPASVYETPLVSYETRPGRQVTWITAPNLIERVLVDDADSFTKTAMELRVLGGALGQGVLTATGAHWRWQRRTMAPLFRHKEILSYVPEMAAAGQLQLEKWRGSGAGIKQIDQDMIDATFTIIARTMLAGGEPSEAAAIKRASARFLSRISWEMAFAMLQFPSWMPHPGTYRIWRAIKTMREAILALVERRRREPGPETDLLGRLLAAKDPETGAPMPDELLVDNLLTLLEAGHETTARALTWALYILARAPDWQDRVRQEVKDVAGDEPIGPEHVQHLVVTEQVMKEAMRLYPPAPVVLRTPVTSIKFEDTWLPQGSLVVIPIYCVHRHRKLWTDPDLFNPDRFSPQFEDALPRCQYMPFGAGQRICLGMSFAMVEAKVLLATLVRGAVFDWDGHHEPEPISRITLRPGGGMPLMVTPTG